MILRGTVFSETLGMETSIAVIAPSSRETDEPRRLVYLLHGLCGNSNDWLNYTMLPNYVGKHNICVVMPEVGRSFYANMKFGLDYFSYVAEELPEICLAAFNIETKREDTAVMGGSMGGYGALKCALTYPERYGFCAAFAPACLFFKSQYTAMKAQGMDKVREMLGERLARDFAAMLGPDGEPADSDDLGALAQKIAASDFRPRIYAACGEEDDLLEDNRKFSHRLREAGFNFEYQEWQGAHDWRFFDEALRRGLDRFIPEDL